MTADGVLSDCFIYCGTRPQVNFVPLVVPVGTPINEIKFCVSIWCSLKTGANACVLPELCAPAAYGIRAEA